MEHTIKVTNWDGEALSFTVLCDGDIRKVASAAHREMGKRKNKKGQPYTTYMLVRIDDEQPPYDVVCK